MIKLGINVRIFMKKLLIKNNKIIDKIFYYKLIIYYNGRID